MIHLYATRKISLLSASVVNWKLVVVNWNICKGMLTQYGDNGTFMKVNEEFPIWKHSFLHFGTFSIHMVIFRHKILKILGKHSAVNISSYWASRPQECLTDSSSSTCNLIQKSRKKCIKKSKIGIESCRGFIYYPLCEVLSNFNSGDVLLPNRRCLQVGIWKFSL